MPGYNHYSWCSCGWCLKRRGIARQKPKPVQVSRLRFEQITIPNAKCPVCGETVFYYRNEHGSSVFFEELGPPWPKHPCTDNQRASGATRRPQRRDNGAEPQWRSSGWIALEYLKSERLGDWIVLCFEVIETGEYRRILSPSFLDCAKGSLVYMLEWDNEFCTELEHLDAYFSPVRTLGWKYDKWFNASMTKAVDARRPKRR